MTDLARSTTPDSFPRWVLWTVGFLLLFSLLSVGLIRITGNGPDQLRQPCWMSVCYVLKIAVMAASQ